MRLTRVTLAIIACIISLGFYQLMRHLLHDVEPQTFQATEEVMVDVANLLAEFAEERIASGNPDTDELRRVFEGAHRREFEARIFEHLKREVGLNVYVTDKRGMVVFDSQNGRREGQDLSLKSDVFRTLRGHYGARSSREDPDDVLTSVMFVAAPIGDPQAPTGVLTVFKPQLDIFPMVRERRRIIYSACAMIGGGVIFLIAAVFWWLFRPIARITEYARAIERGERPAKPKLGIGREVNTLARAMGSMRDALENRAYVERYVHTLTHELKSPLAAIRGAAELLNESMPPETRARFLTNIRAETARSERLINRLLELSSIESRSHLEHPEEHDFTAAVSAAADQARPLAELAGVSLAFQPPDFPVRVSGDAFILRAAVTNLLENAIDFSPPEGAVEISLAVDSGVIVLRIRDFGPGIPDYARERIFERFYSLRHHSNGRKGTGLGLTLVKEAAELHRGTISLEAAENGPGTVATLRLPAV